MINRAIQIIMKRDNEYVKANQKSKEVKDGLNKLLIYFNDLSEEEQTDEELDKIISYLDEHNYEYTIEDSSKFVNLESVKE